MADKKADSLHRWMAPKSAAWIDRKWHVLQATRMHFDQHLNGPLQIKEGGGETPISDRHLRRNDGNWSPFDAFSVHFSAPSIQVAFFFHRPLSSPDKRSTSTRWPFSCALFCSQVANLKHTAPRVKGALCPTSIDAAQKLKLSDSSVRPLCPAIKEETNFRKKMHLLAID